MITWVMVGLLLAAESTCGKNIATGNETLRDEVRQKNNLIKTGADDEDIYRKYIIIIIIKSYKNIIDTSRNLINK